MAERTPSRPLRTPIHVPAASSPNGHGAPADTWPSQATRDEADAFDALQTITEPGAFLVAVKALPPDRRPPALERFVTLIEALPAIPRDAWLRLAQEIWPNSIGVVREHIRDRRRAGRFRDGEDAYRCSDVGNAERFVDQHGDDVRHCHALRSWLIWTDRWRADETNQIVELAKRTARSIYAEASDADTEEERKIIAQWAMASESAAKISAMVQLAESTPRIAVRVTDLDADPWLLQCPNGVVDLRTGALRPGERDDLLTWITAAPYVPGARHPLWDAFLARVIPDAALRQYAHRWAGYCLTGSMREDTFAIAHGPTKSGKTTFTGALHAAMGDYAATADISTFALSRTQAGGAREDLARLRGKRLVISSEVPDGMKIDVARVKEWTGGAPLVARPLYKSSFQFEPRFKITIAANYLPTAPDHDGAYWERAVVLPFPTTIPVDQRDPTIRETLLNPAGAAGAAVLAWAVEGALAWQRDGLGPRPPLVATATAAYRARMSPIAEFVADALDLDPAAWTPSGDLWAAFERWARLNNKERSRSSPFLYDDLPKLSRKEFGQAVAALDGVHAEERYKTKTRGYVGLRLKDAWAEWLSKALQGPGGAARGVQT